MTMAFAKPAASDPIADGRAALNAGDPAKAALHFHVACDGKPTEYEARYWLYSAPTDRLLTGITPTLELHVRTPLNQRDPNGNVYFQDQVNVTAGAHFRFNRAVISGAVVVPLVGPKPFDVEAIGYASYWF